MIQLHSKILWRFHDYWLRKCTHAGWIARDVIEPGELGSVLPHVFMIDRIVLSTGARRFRFRLVGTGVTRLTGRDSTGRFVDEVVAAEQLAMAEGPYDAVCDNARPIAKRGPLVWIANRSWVESEVLLLPASRGGDRVDMVFGAVVESGRQPTPLIAIDAKRSVEYDRVEWGPDFTFAATAKVA